MSIKILVVDDLDLLRQTIKRSLENKLQGAEVFDAGCVDGAKQMIAETQFHFAVVDVQMPGPCTNEFCRELNERGTNYIRITGVCDDELDTLVPPDVRGLAVFKKPFSLEMIATFIAGKLGMKWSKENARYLPQAG